MTTIRPYSKGENNISDFPLLKLTFVVRNGRKLTPP